MTKKMDRIQDGLIAAILVSCFGLFALAPSAQAQFFDNAGKSARGMGMGEVFMASSTDANGYSYSPASLARIESRQVGLGYAKPIAAISELMVSQINIVMPTGNGSGLGLGVSYEGIDDASDIVVTGGYGVSLGNLTVGANAKLLYWKATGQPNAWGAGTDEDLSKVSFAVDASADMALGDAVQAGAYVRNVGLGINSEDPFVNGASVDPGKLPIEVGAGLLFHQSGVGVEVDGGWRNGVTLLRAGAEAPVGGENLKVRGGYVFESDFEEELERSDLNVGVGYTFGSLQFDYAYNVPFAMENTSGKHFVSFGFSF